MPQDSLRSIVYRSFVTCDDPKGVVECGTIRRSKSGSEKMEHKNEGRKAKSKSNLYVAQKAEREQLVTRGAIEEVHSSSSYQLMEVSRGAHKLNQVTNSLSRGLWCDVHSKDIAKDLLKGALDLQESLQMLGKLQEASHYMARLKKKEKQKCDRVRNDRVIQRTNSSPVGERMKFQNPRLSADGSSRDCIEELREVIRDSLARQNLLPNVNAEEKICFSRRYIESASDIPSTSSSQSSTIQTDYFTSMDSSVSSGAIDKNTRGPSLIAKLMGLEEMPPKTLQTNSQREVEGKKIFSQQRPVFEIETPKVRKPQFVLEKEDPERRSVKEILETLHFKGLLKSNSIKEIKYDSQLSSDIFPERRLNNDSTPIVLIKPRRDSRLQPQEKFASVFQEMGGSGAESKVKNPKGKEEVPSNINDYRNRSLKLNEISRRVESEETQVKGLSQQEGAKNSKEKESSNGSLKLNEISRRVEAEETQVKGLSQQEGAKNNKEKESSNGSLNLIEMSRRVEAKETPVKRLSQQEGAKDIKAKESRPAKKEVQTKHELSTKAKSSGPISRPSLKKEANDKGIDKVAKPSISSKKPVEKEAAKVKNESKSKGQLKVTPPMPIKHEKASNVMKNKVSRQQSATLNSNSNHTPQKTIVHGLSERKKSPTRKGKNLSKAKTVQITAEKLEDKGSNETIDLASENDTVLEVCIDTEDQIPKKEGTGHTDIEIGEKLDRSESAACVVTLVTTDDQNNSKSTEEVDEDSTIAVGTGSESLMIDTGLKALLLSSPAFLIYVEELFDLNTGVPTTSQKFDISEFTESDVKLFLDCANEFAQRRSFPDVQMIHPPLLTLVGNSKSCISLERLLKETCDSVETLRSYSDLAGGNYPIDSLCAMLERDINRSELLSGIWDLGWRKGFSVDDTMQVVDDIENQLISGLIEELCA